MDLSARHIHEKQFHDAWRGYNQEEVDDFLDKIAETLDRVQRENRALQGRLRELDQAVSTSRDTEEMLKKTLVTAQQAAEEAISSAKGKAEALIAGAEERARLANEQSSEKISSAEVEARRKALEADREHQIRKRELDASIERLRAFETELKQRLTAFLQQQIRALDGLAGTVQSPRPPDAARPQSGGPAAQPSAAQPPPAQRPSEQASATQARPAGRAHAAPERSTTDPPPKMIQLPTETEVTRTPERRGVRGFFTRDEG